MTAKADRIKELINDPHIKEAFENVRNKYRKLLESDTDATGNTITDEDVLEARRMLFLTRKVEQDLEKAIEDGELEDFQANEQKRPTLGDKLWPRQRH